MPKVETSILIWARESAGLSLEEAAHKLGIKDSKQQMAVEKLEAYEAGEKQPSRSVLLKMAKQYRRPLLTFYLQRPPKKGDRGKDFRTLLEPAEGRQDVFVDQLIREIKATQSTLRQAFVDEEEADALSWIGQYSTNDGVDKVVKALREIISMDLNQYRSKSNQENAFKLLRQHIEKQRVMVLLRCNLGSYHTNISVDTYRGFALADPIAPFIVINDLDSKAAWAFTLLHEMAHLLLGQTGVSNISTEKKIEKFCNDVASEYLLPQDEFGDFVLESDVFDEYVNQIGEFAVTNKVSSSHIAYRLFKRGDINKQEWEELSSYFKDQWLRYRSKQKDKNKDKDGGPDYYVVRRHKLGMFTDLVHRYMRSGTLTTTKAGRMLGVKAMKLHNLFEVG